MEETQDFTYDHKNELGTKFVMTTDMPEKSELEKCTTQELAFLMKTVMTFGKHKEGATDSSENTSGATQGTSAKNASGITIGDAEKDATGYVANEDFMKKFMLFHKVYIEKIKDADKLYFMINPKTGYPFLDGKDMIWMFTTTELAQQAVKHYEQTGLHLQFNAVEQKEIERYFIELYMLGMEDILVDMGGYMVPLHRAEILPPPDWSKIPMINRPVMNPELSKYLLIYRQLVLDRKKGERMSEIELAVLNQVVGLIAQARFLCPVQYEKDSSNSPDQDGKVVLKKDTTITFANITNSSGENALPVFTDWNMFRKMYQDSQWNGQIITYKDALALAEERIIVINPLGIEFHIQESLHEALDKACEYYEKKEKETESTVH